MQLRRVTERPWILYVDDEPAHWAALRELLRNDFEILTASSGAQALAALGTAPIRIVLAEQRVPSGGEVDLLEAMWRHHPRGVSLVLTGYEDEQTVRKAIERGQELHFYFGRPWRAGELRLVLLRAARDLPDQDTGGTTGPTL